MKKDILKTFKITFLALVVTLGVNYVFAWTGPLLPAPNGNTPAPINVGTTDQVKNSGLGINALSVFGASYFQGNVGVGVISPTSKLDVSGNISATGDVTASGNVKGSNVCIGADCRASWPSGAGSTAWNDITGKPAGFADNVDNVGSGVSTRVVSTSVTKLATHSSAKINCAPNELVVGGGGSCAGDPSYLKNPIDIDATVPEANGWRIDCSSIFSDKINTATVYAICLKK